MRKNLFFFQYLPEACPRYAEHLSDLTVLETIDEMNHHIRNALQVISFNSQATGEAKLAEIDQAVERIHWAISEILPKVEPEFTGFEGPANNRARD